MELGTDFGAAFSLTGAAVFYLLTVYILTRNNKDISHYLFSLALIFTGTSEFLAFFEITGTPERAYFLLKFDLSCLALSSYFLLLFSDYFREGLNRKFMAVSSIPAVFIILMVFTVMIKGVEMGAYGWAGVYNEWSHILFSTYGLSYVGVALWIFIYLRKTVEDTVMLRKITILAWAMVIAVIGGFINTITIVFWGRVFPIMETSIMLCGIIATLAFSK